MGTGFRRIIFTALKISEDNRECQAYIAFGLEEDAEVQETHFVLKGMCIQQRDNLIEKCTQKP